MSIIKEFLCSKEKECLRNASFYFSLCVGISILILFASNDPKEFFRIMKLPISNRINFPLFLVIGAALLAVIGCYYIIKKCDQNKLLYEFFEYSENQQVQMDDSRGYTKIDTDPLDEIQEEETSSKCST